MTSNQLRFIWYFRLCSSIDFRDTNGESLEIIDFGDQNTNFRMAKIKHKGVVWIGNIEFNVKPSDAIVGQYPNNTVLYVVYQRDEELVKLEQRNIPVLELKPYIDRTIFQICNALYRQENIVSCEDFPYSLPICFSEELLLRKLDAKSEILFKALKKYKNDYEAVFFHCLAYVFGLKVNAEVFQKIAESVDFSVIKKIRHNRVMLEALLFGLSGWLNEALDEEMRLWKREYDFIKIKFKLPDILVSPKFYKLRPANFPTIRLSQLAGLYHVYPNLFSKILEVEDVEKLRQLFEGISASGYWDYHFVFGKITEKRNSKSLTKNFVDLLLLNAILPLRYHYLKDKGCEVREILEFYKQLPAESNSILTKWQKLGLGIHSAMESQAFLFLNK